MEINLNKIRLDASPQVRAELNRAVAEDYAERMRAGDVFPPVIAFSDGTDYILADGFHRVRAAQICERTTIDADIRQGTRADALRCALLANVAHGLRRSNRDKRQAVVVALQEFAGASDRAIAELCAVGPELVGDVRRELSVFDNSQNPSRRKGRDGKSYSAQGSRRGKTAKAKEAPATAPAPVPGPAETQTDRDHYRVDPPSLPQRLENFRKDIAMMLDDYPDKAPLVAVNLEVILKNTRQFIANRSANIASAPAINKFEPPAIASKPLNPAPQ